MGDKTLDEISTVLDDFSKQIEKLKNQPAAVDAAFDELASDAAAAEGGALFGVIGAAVGYAYGSMTGDDFTGYMSEHKQEIKDKIQELLDKLAKAIEALRAPIALLNTSGDWLKLKSQIGGAQNEEVVNGNLSGYWKGSSALKYAGARTVQDTAMDTAKSICDTLNKSLVAVSNAAWTYYTDVVKQLVSFLTSFGAAVAKIASVVSFTEGVSSAIDLLKTVIDNVVTYMQTLTTALKTEQDAINNISSATDNAKGFLGNKWPQSASTKFDSDSEGDSWQAE
ncbi:hypothetical protein [Nocardia sp. NPDC004604]|uniref:hypothetical protein n=1 Tax=Nocardia sp. NPDC004604 TaxID=3157013 RepID=UPI0033BDE3A8